MKDNNPIRKWYQKTWAIANFYKYDIYQVTAGNLMWFEATPTTKGVTRTANDEKTLRAILENDAINMNKFWGKVR